MIKAKKYDIAETNIANLGSDLEKNVRAAAAGHEDAWKTAGKEPGLEIWRIEKFKVVAWPKEEYGNFFSNDSYIVLNTYKRKNEDKLRWDIHFWLGETTSQDEAGTAAYKTVELDDFLGTEPVQHRECEGFESDLFHSYFPKGVKYLEGGIESGFRHVKPEEYKARLLHIKGGRKTVRVSQVPAAVSSLNVGDCFILDHGLKVFQFQPSKAGIAEKTKAATFVRSLDDERGSKVQVIVLDEHDKSQDAEEFFKLLGGKLGDAIASAADGGADDAVTSTNKKLFRLSDASGKAEFKLEGENKLSKKQLDAKDCFILDGGAEIFCWVGKAASAQERKLGLSYAQNYLNSDKSRPSHLPITKVMDGAENEAFYAYFDE